uniref:Uncharacterized protein n=1 Tax=Oryza sativa subsp. japonica TaxID=39947 RepID=Q337V9_ORYSJ|nr:hypothetical protein LOC_Os10g29960 [Oryza sativa Japonica Group]
MGEEPADGAVIGEAISGEAGVDEVRREGDESRRRRWERGEQCRTEVVFSADAVGGAGPPRCRGVGEQGEEEPDMTARGSEAGALQEEPGKQAEQLHGTAYIGLISDYLPLRNRGSSRQSRIRSNSASSC